MSIQSVKLGISNMDPRLQNLIARQKAGRTLPMLCAASPNDIPVIGKVNDLQAWNQLAYLDHGVSIQNDDIYVVTAHVPISKLESLHDEAFVTSLKVSTYVRPVLFNATDETGLNSEHLVGDIAESDGIGVVLGVVDYGADFRHPHFLDDSAQTRLAYIWDQSGEPDARSPYRYGRLISKSEINAALESSSPYGTLMYRPGLNAHGTHVMSIAASSGTTRGAAPGAELAFVDLNTLGAGVSGVVGKDIGDSKRMLEAVKYIFDQAGDKPCVVNLSLGTNGGSHDGTSPLEQGLDGLVKEKPNRAIVLAASNSYADGIHKSGQLREGESTHLTWNIHSDDRTDNEVEVWYSGQDVFNFEIVAPTGQSFPVPLGENLSLREGNEPVVFVTHVANDPDNGDNVINIFQDPSSLINGQWQLKITGTQVHNGRFDAWIERDDRGQSTFSNDDKSGTLSSMGTGEKTIAVGAYKAHGVNTPIAWFSSAGPSRDGKKKPEISAPGHDVWAAASETTRMRRDSGTSMASPFVAGIVARIFSVALSRGISLKIDDTRKILMDTARYQQSQGANEGRTEKWDPRYGFGRVSVQALSHPLLNG